MTPPSSSDTPRRPWPLYALAALLGLCGAGLTIGVFILPPSQRAVNMAGSHRVQRALGIGGAPAPQESAIPPGLASTYVAWSPALDARLDHSNLARGAFVASSCSACHGPDGRGGTELAPSLAGQSADVLWKQLQDFRSGARNWPVMNAVARALSENDILAVASYLSTVHGDTIACASPGADRAADIPRLVEIGDIRRLIPPCASCHEQRNGNGVPMFAPRLEGQRADYLERQLLLFHSGWRHNDTYSHMRIVAQRLDDVEIKQLAQSYAMAGTTVSHACSPLTAGRPGETRVP